MNKYYFTFGSDPRFPFGREEFIEVRAWSARSACALFREVYPNRPGSTCLNCADYYTETEFNQFRAECYGDRRPVQVIIEGGQVTMKNLLTFELRGLYAHDVIVAEHASFYGARGEYRDCAIARKTCLEEAEKLLDAAGLVWNWCYLIDAHSVDTTGTKTPYLATVTVAFG